MEMMPNEPLGKEEREHFSIHLDFLTYKTTDHQIVLTYIPSEISWLPLKLVDCLGLLVFSKEKSSAGRWYFLFPKLHCGSCLSRELNKAKGSVGGLDFGRR